MCSIYPINNKNKQLQKAFVIDGCLNNFKHYAFPLTVTKRLKQDVLTLTVNNRISA